MQYVRVKQDGSFEEVSLRQIIRFIQNRDNISLPDLKNVSEARRNDLLADYNVFPLTVEPRPTINPETQTIAPGDITESGGVYTKGWIVTDIPVAEREAAAAEEADQFLDESGGMIIELALAVVDTALTLDTRNRNNQQQPTTQQVRQGLRDRVLFYARKRRGLT